MSEHKQGNLWVTAFRKGRRIEINMSNGEERAFKSVEAQVECVQEERSIDEVLERGVKLFQHLLVLAGNGEAVGVTYEQFWALIHGMRDFKEVEGRHFELARDVNKVLIVAQQITATHGGVTLSCGEVSINSGMDCFIWDCKCRRFKSVFMSTSYSEAQWLVVFPDDRRRLLVTREGHFL